MLRAIKNKLSDGGQAIYDHLTPEFVKNFLKNSISDERKDQLRKLLGAGQKQARMRKVNHAKYRLKNLGFVEAGYQEMLALFEQTEDHLLTDLAGFELALWHADQYNEEDAKKSLYYLDQLRTEKISNEQKRKRAILRIENLNQLGRVDEAEEILADALAHQEHGDLYLTGANLTENLDDRLEWINKALDFYKIAPVYLANDSGQTVYDRLEVKELAPDPAQDQAKITVIIPVYNAGEQVRTAIDSILKQTWTNIEVLVVDDCSTDETASIIQSYLDVDPRVKFFQTPVNSGPYVARNIALGHATGDFVTINDADDWSHPEKLATQAKHLLKHSKVMGNTSGQARATETLQFYRRGKPGLYVFSNMSSFMFRRKEVLAKLGHWDSVRFAADSEFILRIKKVFGPKATVELPVGPLSFQRQSEDSLTGNSVFGFPGYFMGVRKEYREAQMDYHQKTDDLYYSYPQQKRPFQTPNPLLPQREVGKGESRIFEIVYGADFRDSNEELDLMLTELQKLQKTRKRLAIFQINRYEPVPDQPISARLRTLVNELNIEIVCYGEHIVTDKLIIRTPEALEESQIYLPDIKAEKAEIIADKPLTNRQSEIFKSYFDQAFTVKKSIN